MRFGGRSTTARATRDASGVARSSVDPSDEAMHRFFKETRG